MIWLLTLPFEDFHSNHQNFHVPEDMTLIHLQRSQVSTVFSPKSLRFLWWPDLRLCPSVLSLLLAIHLAVLHVACPTMWIRGETPFFYTKLWSRNSKNCRKFDESGVHGYAMATFMDTEGWNYLSGHSFGGGQETNSFRAILVTGYPKHPLSGILCLRNVWHIKNYRAERSSVFLVSTLCKAIRVNLSWTLNAERRISTGGLTHHDGCLGCWQIHQVTHSSSSKRQLGTLKTVQIQEMVYFMDNPTRIWIILGYHSGNLRIFQCWISSALP